jgi:hypothetical protein
MARSQKGLNPFSMPKTQSAPSSIHRECYFTSVDLKGARMRNSDVCTAIRQRSSKERSATSRSESSKCANPRVGRKKNSPKKPICIAPTLVESSAPSGTFPFTTSRNWRVPWECQSRNCFPLGQGGNFTIIVSALAAINRAVLVKTTTKTRRGS